MMLHPDHATIELRRCYVPNCIVPHDPQPMISVCTVTVEELSRRTLMGEEEWDVIEEYTSWIWFFDRDGFRAALHLARRILWSGEVLYGVSAREPTKCAIDGEPGKLVVSLSAHHTEGEQRKAPSDERMACRCAVREAPRSEGYPDEWFTPELCALQDRIFFSTAPFNEVIQWLKECQNEGRWPLPTRDAEAFVGRTILLAGALSGPVRRKK